MSGLGSCHGGNCYLEFGAAAVAVAGGDGAVVEVENSAADRQAQAQAQAGASRGGWSPIEFFEYSLRVVNGKSGTTGHNADKYGIRPGHGGDFNGGGRRRMGDSIFQQIG